MIDNKLFNQKWNELDEKNVPMALHYVKLYCDSLNERIDKQDLLIEELTKKISVEQEVVEEVVEEVVAETSTEVIEPEENVQE